jgi:nitrite reductase (NADH) small subunit
LGTSAEISIGDSRIRLKFDKKIDGNNFFQVGSAVRIIHKEGFMAIVAKISEVPNFGKKVVSVSGRDILLVNIKGTIYAVENECPHQGSPLSAAVVKDGYLSCPRHGYRFSLTDGKCAEHPEFVLATFSVQLNGDEILVDI